MEKFAEKVIDDGGRQIRNQKINLFMQNPEIGVCYDKEAFQSIKKNLEFINNYGKSYHIIICKLEEDRYGSGIVYFQRKIGK